MIDYHGGPTGKIPASSRSARNRGLRQATPKPASAEVRQIMRAGEILQPNKLRKILNPSLPRIPLAESKLMARYASLAGVPAKTDPGAIKRDPDAGELNNR